MMKPSKRTALFRGSKSRWKKVFRWIIVVTLCNSLLWNTIASSEKIEAENNRNTDKIEGIPGDPERTPNDVIKGNIVFITPLEKASNYGYKDSGKELGKGGSATVVEGRDKENNAVAIKKITNKKVNYDETLDEIKIMEKLAKYPQKNIIAFKEDIRTTEDTYIITELFPNAKTLFGQLESVTKGKFEEKTAKSVMSQIIQGVQHMHKHNIVHRDLSTGNILVTELPVTNDSEEPLELEVKIIDFGFAYDLEQNIGKCTGGTIQYMAPEVFQGKKESKCAKEVDIWSMGIIMYNMLTGLELFDPNLFKFENTENPTEFEIDKLLGEMKKLERKEFQFKFKWPSELSLKARKLIKKMLIFNPQDRIQSKDLLRDDWFTG